MPALHVPPFPWPCPECDEPKAYPYSVTTGTGLEGLVALRLRCRACRREWGSIIKQLDGTDDRAEPESPFELAEHRQRG